MIVNLQEITIVAQTEIPAISEVEIEGKIESLGELRDFRWHEQLKTFLPAEEEISFSFVKLAPEKILKSHVHPTSSMIICYRGSGDLFGDKTQSLVAGDVVAVPPGCVHGFKGTGEEGLFALSIQFGKGLYTDPNNPRVNFQKEYDTYEAVLAFNNECIKEFESHRFLKMLTDGTLDNPRKRQCYVDALQVWSNYNQDLLYARQGTTGERRFSEPFEHHLFEEVGHDKVHAERNESFNNAVVLTEDPVIEAIANWFICQMFRSDNFEKAALIHLVIENGSDIYHKVARPVLNKTVNDHYFHLHEADTEHAALAHNLLNNLSKAQYNALQKTVAKGWKMLAAMTNRVCELVDGVN